MARLFAPIPTPPRHRNGSASHDVRWYTWAPSVKLLLESNLKDLLSLPKPRTTFVRGCAPYGATYTFRRTDLNRALLVFARDSAERLLQTRVDRRIRFFTGLLDAPMSSDLFHKYIALLRTGIVMLTGDPRTALHAPVKAERHDDGFPLHADLFLTDRLWLTFDDVPRGSSGQSLFLARPLFDRIVKTAEFLPREVKKRILSLLDHETHRDAFDEFFALLYSPKNGWSASLIERMYAHCWRLKFRRGEGYLLHDGHWLHGRTAVRGRVSPARFRRLIYGTECMPG